jgi:hypothetical protein
MKMLQLLMLVLASYYFVVVLGGTARAAESKTIVCTGYQIDLDTGKAEDFPLAVIYDEKGGYTCAIARGDRRAKHDPVRPCGSGVKCRFIGKVTRKIYNTYYVDWNKFCREDEFVGEGCPQ